MAARDELVVAIAGRYAQGDRVERGRILDEFSAVTGFHRKHAMRLLRVGEVKQRSGARPGRRVYGEAVREALIVVWEASDRICGKRLRPLLPILVEAMERHGHLQLKQELRIKLLAMSAATIDRALRDIRQAGTATRRRAAPSAAIRRSVPVRTFDGWDDPAPGFVEADLVAHSGPVARGSFVQTLVLTDIATGWIECAPLLVREQRLLTEVLSELRKLLPFALLGLDTDNDSVFMNETVRDYCEKAGIEFTRCRPYRKNDQAWVEQKNGAVVRRTIGYRRFEGLEAAAALARLYAAMRLFVNFFQPSFKLATKARDGAKVKKRYHSPATPEVRPTSAPKAKPKRLRRRPDPFAAVTTELRGWFEAEPWHTSRELLERLQTEHPDVYPDGQLRTLQRRLKEWRREAAHQMVFGTMTANPRIAPDDVKGSPLSNGAKHYFSERENGPKSPVDLPLRLDDAAASPTTPQGQHQ